MPSIRYDQLDDINSGVLAPRPSLTNDGPGFESQLLLIQGTHRFLFPSSSLAYDL
jgi:hypothetical protein